MGCDLRETVEEEERMRRRKRVERMLWPELRQCVSPGPHISMVASTVRDAVTPHDSAPTEFE